MEIKIYVNHEEEKVFTEKQYKEYLEELKNSYYRSNADFNEWCKSEGVLCSDLMFGDEALRERIAFAYEDYCEKTVEENTQDDGWTEIIMEV